MAIKTLRLPDIDPCQVVKELPDDLLELAVEIGVYRYGRDHDPVIRICNDAAHMFRMVYDQTDDAILNEINEAAIRRSKTIVAIVERRDIAYRELLDLFLDIDEIENSSRVPDEPLDLILGREEEIAATMNRSLYYASKKTAMKRDGPTRDAVLDNMKYALVLSMTEPISMKYALVLASTKPDNPVFGVTNRDAVKEIRTKREKNIVRKLDEVRCEQA